jgi:hypothetical protein
MTRPKLEYRLETGEVISVYEAVNDPRNVHKVSRNLIRQRLRAGVTYPHLLWAKPTGLPMEVFLLLDEYRREIDMLRGEIQRLEDQKEFRNA